jgi:succinate-semialdehyde dehydrogenase/glutarate-semialdehyde dehydrogenase
MKFHGYHRLFEEEMMIQSINPATGETLKTFEAHTPAQVEEKLRGAAEAFQKLRATPMSKRAEWMGGRG